MTITIPMKLPSAANLWEHWRKRSARNKAHRMLAQAELAAARVDTGTFPVTIRLVRVGPRKLDSDNVSSAFKAIRDGVADYFGVDDGDAGYTWEYAQETAKAPAVRIEITPTPVNT